MTQLEVASQLGPYRIGTYIGRGGMGVVYRAEHVHLGRQVALKLLAPELAENESFRERFVRESRVAAQVDHPNVIPIYEAGEADGTYFIAMRYVEGQDLREILHTSGPLDLDRALEVLGQVAGALDAAHGQGLVHRDVKPGNILVVGGSGHCYLTDFGLTKAISSDTAFTATGQFVGTTDYVAPEQIEGKELDRRTDVYSLGCVFYECLAGTPPFRRETDMAVMWAHMQEPPPRVTDRRPDLPAGLDQVIATAMAKSKDDRFPSCSTFAAAARSAIEIGLGRPAASPAATPPEAPAPTPAPAPSPPSFASRAYTSPGDPVPSQGAYYPSEPYGYGVPAAAEPERRQKPLTAIALVIAALLVAGGGTAAALIATSQKKQPAAAAAPAAEPTTVTAQAPSPPRKPKKVTPPTVTKPSTPAVVPSPPPSSSSDALRAEQ
ncbi:MAG: hypothetical protein QOE06_3129, partial [Thermoleophilaceae bacterium]|nr:hypothetical protein [Thermoleophilaceae bacterium]